MTALIKSFGAPDVTPGNKAVKIKADGSRRSADVIVAADFHRYSSTPSVGNTYAESASSTPAVLVRELPRATFRELHYQTPRNEWSFKPMVRVLKNVRSKLVTTVRLMPGIAPSYFLEGLLYNVPDDKFGNNLWRHILRGHEWILQAKRSDLRCANWKYYLFGASAVQWTVANCDLFLNKVVDLWNNWGQV